MTHKNSTRAVLRKVHGAAKFSHKLYSNMSSQSIRSNLYQMYKTASIRTYDARGKKGKSMLCPITGKKFKEKDVLELQKGKSGFAASGDVVASKYTPTMT